MTLTLESPALALRPRTRADADDLFALFNEPEFRDSALMRDPFQNPGEVDAFLDGVQAARRYEIVVLKDGAAVAFGALYAQGEHFDHCGTLTMGVRRAHRGVGIGGLLLRALVATARDHARLAKLALTVLTDNAPAIRLYRRHGFAIEGLHRRFARRGAGFCDAYSMARLFDATAPEKSHGAAGLESN